MSTETTFTDCTEFVSTGGSCAAGNHCRFRHPFEAGLGTKRVCRSWIARRTCPKGVLCPERHPSADIMKCMDCPHGTRCSFVNKSCPFRHVLNPSNRVCSSWIQHESCTDEECRNLHPIMWNHTTSADNPSDDVMSVHGDDSVDSEFWDHSSRAQRQRHEEEPRNPSISTRFPDFVQENEQRGYEQHVYAPRQPRESSRLAGPPSSRPHQGPVEEPSSSSSPSVAPSEQNANPDAFQSGGSFSLPYGPAGGMRRSKEKFYKEEAWCSRNAWVQFSGSVQALFLLLKESSFINLRDALLMYKTACEKHDCTEAMESLKRFAEASTIWFCRFLRIPVSETLLTGKKLELLRNASMPPYMKSHVSEITDLYAITSGVNHRAADYVVHPVEIIRGQYLAQEIVIFFADLVEYEDMHRQPPATASGKEFVPRKLCYSFIRGRPCPKGPDCKFAHARIPGTCPNGHRCQYLPDQCAFLQH